ncbi:hypothetical protein HOY82DRAFT_33099 [Tuber indicum]|nr:hypothetical protein HOY82DRAFT_75896 [Tuber indicum]KAG0136806.1 hypothetical protein HOY82DRAFT_33099 [Tuber indicum]
MPHSKPRASAFPPVGISPLWWFSTVVFLFIRGIQPRDRKAFFECQILSGLTKFVQKKGFTHQSSSAGETRINFSSPLFVFCPPFRGCCVFGGQWEPASTQKTSREREIVLMGCGHKAAALSGDLDSTWFSLEDSS